MDEERTLKTISQENSTNATNPLEQMLPTLWNIGDIGRLRNLTEKERILFRV